MITSLKDIISTLRISSQESVIDGNIPMNDDVKNYLHIQRSVEKDFRDLLTKASTDPKGQLVLLAGNVGDGKSHLLSKMLKESPEVMSKFEIYNDATESVKKNKTYLENLSDILNPFNDQNILNSRNKIILAINLGTLTNFLNDSIEFSCLQKFVQKNRILDSVVSDSAFDDSSYFQCINLTDYHLFLIENGKQKSYDISSLLNKITLKNEKNPFFNAYQADYKDYPELAKKCPVRFNYEYLMQDSVKERIALLIAEVIVKYKLIVSMRTILNVIYDLLVPASISSMTEIRYKNFLKKIDPEEFLKNLLPIYMFDNPEVSEVFSKFTEIDPLCFNSEKLDDVILALTNSTNIKSFFDKENLMLTDLISNFFQDNELQRETIIRFYLRSYFLSNGYHGYQSCPFYEDYVKVLYNYHCGNRKELFLFYEAVRSAVYLWNGTVANKSNKSEINLLIGSEQNSYQVSSWLDLKPELKALAAVETNKLERFTLSARVSFSNNSSDIYTTCIDYKLYELIRKINLGYRPNKIDKNNHIDFGNFVDALCEATSNNELSFTERHTGKRNQYKLTFHEFYGYCFEEC